MPGARKNQIARDPELARLGTLYKVAKTSYSGLSAHAFQPLTVFLSLSLSLSLSLCLLFISSPVSHRLAIVNCPRLFYFTSHSVSNPVSTWGIATYPTSRLGISLSCHRNLDVFLRSVAIERLLPPSLQSTSCLTTSLYVHIYIRTHLLFLHTQTN